MTIFFADQICPKQAGQREQSVRQGEEGDHPLGGRNQIIGARPQEVQGQVRGVRR